MKKTQRLLGIVLLLAILMTGCQQTKPVEAPKTGFQPSMDIHHTASFTVVGELNNFEALEAVINGFQSIYPNVTITYEKLDDFNKMLGMRLQNDPSVGCYVSSGAFEHAVDLTDASLDTSVFSYVLDTCRRDDRLYGIPLGMNISGLVVNETLLQREGLSIPTTLSEFCHVCDKLVAKGYQPIQQHPNYVCRYLFEPFVWGQIVQAEDEAALIRTLTSGEAGSMDAMRPVFALYDSFVEKEYLDTEKNALIADGYDAAILNFFEGDVAFMPANGDTVSGMKKRESKSEAFTANPFSYHFIYAPLHEKGVLAEQSLWRCLSVNEFAQSKDIALEFVRFLATTKNLNLLAQTKGLPTAAALSEDPRFAGINDANGLFIYPWQHDIPYVAWNSVIGRLSEYARGETASPDDALALVEQDVASQI